MSSRKPNREILTGGKKYAQKQAKRFGVDEVVFDKESRTEYLTGFHKRKVQRQKKAQEFNKEQERLQKLEERRKTREERKKDMEDQLSKFNETVKKITNYQDSDGEDDDWTTGTKKKAKKSTEEDEEKEWNGFEEQEEEEESDDEETKEYKENIAKGILKRKEVYSTGDETTVTIESMNPDEDDLQVLAKANNVDLEKSKEILDKSIDRAKKYAKHVNSVSKPKKKKFRYLTKNERKANNYKQKQSKFKSRNRE